MKKYFGNYLGICIQNNDPEKRGRIKVFVPHISATVYDKWNKIVKDKNFAFPGKDNPDLNEITDDLKAILPWAECAGPLFGGNASGRYQALNENGTTSDSNYWDTTTYKEGSRASQNYIDNNVYPDAFEETGKNNNRFFNPYSKQYTPSHYANLARGLFTIPNVGAHVWVFFNAGLPNCPVYFASSYGTEDWNHIYSISQDTDNPIDYPSDYENVSLNDGGELNSDAKQFRAKTVFNSNKHSLEFIDTDLKEILKLTHYSGSFKEFTNYANIELATGNDQKMVLNDQFLTVQKNQSTYIGMNQETIIAGDQYTTIGNAKKDDIEQITKILKGIHDYKRLFDIKRAKAGDAPNEVSSKQTRQGIYALCPVCNGLPYVPTFLGKLFQGDTIPINLCAGGFPVFLSLKFPVPGAYFALGTTLPALIGQIGIYKGNLCDTCNGSGVTQINSDPIRLPGFSPSTQDGKWIPDPAKLPGGTLDIELVQKAKELAEVERKLGDGDQIIKITKNKVENIGLVMNDMKSFRVDPIGKIRVNGVYVAMEGTYTTYRPSPHVEYVDVDDVPGGDYNLTVGNKYKLLVGAKGINIKTFGPIDMYGTIINFTGEQINISSQNEILIDGGERFSIRARKIALIPFEQNPVAVQGQLHVTRNMVVGGGAYIEGELGVQHITAPWNWSKTEKGNTPSAQTGNVYKPGGVIPTGVIDHVHCLPDHDHDFKHPAWQLYPGQEPVRSAMNGKGVNSTKKLASAIPQTLGVLTQIMAGGSTELVNLVRGFVESLEDKILETVDENIKKYGLEQYGITSAGLDELINAGSGSTYLSYAEFESIVGGPSDNIANSSPLVQNRSAGRSGYTEETDLGAGKVKYVIYYNYVNNEGNPIDRGLKVTTVVNTSNNNEVTYGPVLDQI